MQPPKHYRYQKTREKPWTNDGKLVKLIDGVQIPNLDVLLRERIYTDDEDLFLSWMANDYACRKIEGAKEQGVRFSRATWGAQIAKPNVRRSLPKGLDLFGTLAEGEDFVNYDRVNHLIEMVPRKMMESQRRRDWDIKIRELKARIRNSEEKSYGIWKDKFREQYPYEPIGMLCFMPFLENGKRVREYVKGKIPHIGFVNLPYNPKKVLARGYALNIEKNKLSQEMTQSIPELN